MRLDPAPFANLYPSLDLDKRTYKAFVANLTAIKIYRLDNSHIFAKPNIDNAGTTEIGMVQCVSCHRFEIRRQIGRWPETAWRAQEWRRRIEHAGFPLSVLYLSGYNRENVPPPGEAAPRT